ncbi:hypothetical protein IAD21_00651 [Abditibacteriota bacterium]|nr:hypothetical protein IAD21_00651 [Abditibacteriota bacterium]
MKKVVNGQWGLCDIIVQSVILLSRRNGFFLSDFPVCSIPMRFFSFLLICVLSLLVGASAHAIKCPCH